MHRLYGNSIIICLVLFFTASAVAQAQLPQLTRIDEAQANIQLDGFVDEAVWEDLPVIDGMRVINPDTLAETPYETHIRMFYSEQGIYVSAINYQPEDTLVARMTSRDVELDRDGFVVGIDASGDGLYGYFLRINLGDSMDDASLLPERIMNMQWDGSWNGRTQALDNGWSVEYYIPWAMMPLPQVDAARRQIGFYFERQIGHLGGETWSNPALPLTVNEYLSAFQKYELRDIEPRRQLTFYPFSSTVFDGIKHDTDAKIGTDIYWRPTTNTLLSATLNPDFGTVESDDVVVNLTAFETFFPEKRTFFLEGQDIFNTSPRTQGRRGPGGPIALLNTRRIGGAARFDVPDGVNVIPTDLSQPTELLGAIKLTGQNGNLRYGTLLASEDDTEIRGTLADGSRVDLQAEGRDFVVGRLLYEDTSSGGLRSFGWMGTDLTHSSVDATVNAFDTHFFSADNKWVLDGQVMHSDVDGVTGAGVLGDVKYRPQRGEQHEITATYIDDEFDMNEMGFLTRNDQMNLGYTYNLNESDIPGLRERTTSLNIVNDWNTSGRLVQAGVILNRAYTSLNSNTFAIGLQHFPTRVDDRLGRGTGDFRIPERNGLSLGVSTDRAKSLAYIADLQLRQDDLGTPENTLSAGVAWRPNDRFSADLQLSYTDQESLLIHRGNGNYTSYESHQWAPRLELNYFITAKQQIRFSGQWTALKASENRFWQVNPNRLEHLRSVPNPDNEPDDFVISRLTFQARYRWEIAPLSDLFIVYTRGSNLPSNSFFTFQDLFEQSWNDRIVDSFAIKLRYRFGT
jgi:hypothetical protein